MASERRRPMDTRGPGCEHGGLDATDTSRRDFLRLAAALGLLGSAAMAGDTTAAKPVPIGKEYLARGLVSLSVAHKRGWLQGHAGAAVLATYYFCKENALDERTTLALAKQVDGLMGRNPEDYPAPDPPRGTADPARIVEQLGTQITDLRAGGHDVIFASLALRALRDLPEYATPAIVDGICDLLKLIAARRRPDPDTPYNLEHPLPPYGSTKDIATITLQATLRPWGDVARVGASGVIHWITHADAVVTLEDLGYKDLARRHHPAQRLHINQAVTGDERREPDRAAVDWLGADYWESDTPRKLFQNSWLGGHAFKLPYSLFRMLRLVEDQKLRDACLLRATRLQVPFE
jgi:hypothetical protein